ncbi:hypothetical protein NQ318_002235 [Aromia moschata]|uniref:Uncharacterized protein n=1 Tax=Aromia moschata TaxID=1265417 RepID=A0AAV8Z3G8_9CUCU|nr:hypothetical protein NQ318_002235 [Aromia moschata]
MEAIQFTGKYKKLELKTVPIPKITKANEVLVRVAYSGICGTDLHSILGASPWTPEYTFTLGHEFSGTVVDVGPDVKTFKKGDKVAIDPNEGCQSCEFCHSGNQHYCPVGAISNPIGVGYKDGGWAEYALVPTTLLHKLPNSVTLEQAALAEPLSCIAHGWDLLSPITVGMKILITGAGIIGNLWVCVLHLQGHKNVTVSEPNPLRLDLLRKLNTGYNLITPEQLKKNQEADSAYLFDLIIDCSGYPPAIEHAVTLLNSGGKLCCFGVAPPNAEIKIKPFQIYMQELKIFGVHINLFSFPKALGLLEAMGERYLSYENLGIKTFALKDYEKALEEMRLGSVAKAMFEI